MAKASASVEIKLSQSASEFIAAALDLLERVENADPALLTDDVVESARELRSVVDTYRSEL